MSSIVTITPEFVELISLNLVNTSLSVSLVS